MGIPRDDPGEVTVPRSVRKVKCAVATLKDKSVPVGGPSFSRRIGGLMMFPELKGVLRCE
jgi:hypothetical protein